MNGEIKRKLEKIAKADYDKKVKAETEAGHDPKTFRPFKSYFRMVKEAYNRGYIRV